MILVNILIGKWGLSGFDGCYLQSRDHRCHGDLQGHQSLPDILCDRRRVQLGHKSPAAWSAQPFPNSLYKFAIVSKWTEKERNKRERWQQNGRRGGDVGEKRENIDSIFHLIFI